MALADLKRVTDLFVEGTELVLDENADPPVVMWVNKLNSFQREEASRDGMAARSRMVLATKENGSPDFLRFQAHMAELDDAKVREELLDNRNSERYLAAYDSMRSDPDWKDRIDAASRITPDMGEDEKAAVLKINEEFADEIQKRIDLRREDHRQEYMALDSAGLRDKYRTAWLENHGGLAYRREYTKTNIYYALRTCVGVKRSDGTWDHSSCDNHASRALDNREEVRGLPDGLLTKLQTTIQALDVPVGEARFSDAPSSSSGRQVQPNEEAAASQPSTPEVMSPELATTS